MREIDNQAIEALFASVEADVRLPRRLEVTSPADDEMVNIAELLPAVADMHLQMEVLGLQEDEPATLDDYLAICESVLGDPKNFDVLPSDAINALELFANDAIARQATQQFAAKHGRAPSTKPDDMIQMKVDKAVITSNVYKHINALRYGKDLVANTRGEAHAKVQETVFDKLFSEEQVHQRQECPTDIELVETDLDSATKNHQTSLKKGWLGRIGDKLRSKGSKKPDKIDQKQQAALQITNDIKANEPRIFDRKKSSPDSKRPPGRLRRTIAFGSIALLALGLTMKPNAETADSTVPKEASQTELVAAPTTTEASTTTTTISIDNETYTTIASALAEIERIHNIQPDDPGYDDVVEKTFFLASLQNN